MQDLVVKGWKLDKARSARLLKRRRKLPSKCSKPATSRTQQAKQAMIDEAEKLREFLAET